MVPTTKKFFTVDVKTVDDGSFSGVLSTYGNIDLVGDICEKGCFDASIGRKGTHFPLLFNHNDNEPIGSFDVTDSQTNLSIKGKFNLAVQRGREIHALMKAGDVKGLSIGYIPVKATYDEEGIRHLLEVDLFEGSVTPFPANPLATAEAKKMKEDFTAFKSALIRELKSQGKADDEIDKIVEGTEKELEEPKKEEEKEKEPTEGEGPTKDPKDKSKANEDENEENKEGNEPPKDELTAEEIATLKKLCKDLDEEIEKTKKEMNA